MRWNPPDQWVWSAQPTHAALVSREAFDQVQARIATRSPTSPRAPKASPKPYLLRGRLTCGLCRRRLQGQWVRGEAYYRCRYPAEYAASTQLDHPTNVYLREADLLAKIDGWLNQLTSHDNIETTCRALAAAHTNPDPTGDAQLLDAQHTMADCQRKLARYRAALEAGGDPALVNQWIAEITQQRHDAERRLRELRAAGPRDLDPTQVRALLEEIGDLAAALEVADTQQRAQLYQELGISGLYQPVSRIVTVTADPGVRRRSVRVGGGT
jgi:site-specific DNA recombinase